MSFLIPAENRPSPSEAWIAYVAARGAFLADPGVATGERALRALGAFCTASEMDAAETRETVRAAAGDVLRRVFVA